MNPNKALLQAITDRLDECMATVENDFKPLSDQQLNWKPSAKAWSVNQCLDHLNITNEGYIKVLKGLSSQYGSNIPASTKPYKTSFMGKIMLWMVNPAAKNKMSTPKTMAPTQGNLPRTTLDQFIANQQAAKQLVTHFSQADLNKIKIKSPFASIFTLTLGDVFETISQHSQRHIKQAQRVVATEGFPKE